MTMNTIGLRLLTTAVVISGSSADLLAQKFRHVENVSHSEPKREDAEILETSQTLPVESEEMKEIRERKLNGPWIFSGYRHIHLPGLQKMKLKDFEIGRDNWVYPVEENDISIEETEDVDDATDLNILPESELSIMRNDVVPGWLRDRIATERSVDNVMYTMMVVAPYTIDYAYWNLPTPPVLPEDDVRFSTYLKNLDIPGVDRSKAILPEFEVKKRHWLHNFNTGVQFSQAYISTNWYQGGNNHLALLYNFYWDVQLNQTYHPNLMFGSTVQYKLGINYTNQDKYHKYSISEDIFQYNLKAGFKAFKRWFYSLTMQFKTQFLNNYEQDSEIRKAAFLSPGDLNVGLGMTYNYESKYSTFKFSASIAPLSYNLKTCIDKMVDPAQFNILPGRKTVSQIGSSAECTADWAISSNISLKSRLFAFTDYNYFQGDLETTLSFNINLFLSTQVYAHLRYDSSSELTSSRWKHWMLKEILSFGLSYTFATAP